MNRLDGICNLKNISYNKMSSPKNCTKCGKVKMPEDCIKGRGACRDCNKAICKLYKANNPSKIADYNKTYKHEHKEELSSYNSTYHQEHKERVYERHAVNVKKYKEKKKTDETFKKMNQIRSTIRTFTKGETKTNKYIGCSRDFLLKWIEYNDSSFTMDNYGMGGWCLDHIVPCSKFGLEDVMKCFHWSNVQPLLIKENSKKHCYLKKDDLDRHLEKLKKFTEQTEIRELMLKENIVIPDFDRYAYIDS